MTETLSKPKKKNARNSGSGGAATVGTHATSGTPCRDPCNSNQNIENMRVDSSSSSRGTAGRPGTPAKAGREVAAETQETKVS